MYINDSDGQPIRNVDMDDLTKKFGSPMYQGEGLSNASIGAYLTLPCICDNRPSSTIPRGVWR
jgi:hypothetical protein